MAEASIVFRNADMSGTGKIYVNTLFGASALAARFRAAVHYVDVINSLDEVVHRWEDAKPDWRNSDVLYFHRGFDPYDFERKHDGHWEPWNRASELSGMLAFAFDVAVGNEDLHSEYCPIRCSAHADWTLEELVHEAEAMRRDTPTDDPSAWVEAISDWLCDPDRLFLKYHVEYAALCIKFDLSIPDCRVAGLEIELANIDANFKFKDHKGQH